MAKGRPPKPTRLRVLEGNPGRRPLPANEPQPTRRAPPMPEHLGAEARGEWKRVAPKLAELGVLTEVDRTTLAAYCQAWDRLVKAERELAKNGMVTARKDGYLLVSPWVTIANQASKEMRAYAVEFGLTPAARSRLHIKPPEDDADSKAKATLELID